MQTAARESGVALTAAVQVQLAAAALDIKACVQLASHVDMGETALARLAGAAALLVGSGRRLLLQAALRGSGGSTDSAVRLAQAQLEAMASLLGVLGSWEAGPAALSPALLDGTVGPDTNRQLLPWLLAAATALAPRNTNAAGARHHRSRKLI